MTRRDFQLIAQVFKEQAAPRPLVEAMARVLRTTNPRFDHDRFVSASGAA